MIAVVDIAEYILERQGPMTTMKLQKLVYYSQAWHLAWDGEPLFEARIEAWANGPVVPELHALHKGKFMTAPGVFRHALETRDARITVVFDAVDRHFRWTVPDTIYGGLRTGNHVDLSRAIDEARTCLRTMFDEGWDMLVRSARSHQAMGAFEHDDATTPTG